MENQPYTRGEYVPNPAILKHYGVKGMKWGHRKDRRKGTGNGRVSKTKKQVKNWNETRKADKKAPNANEHDEAKRINQRASRGGTKKLSNQELQKAITRMNLETQYNNLRKNTPEGRLRDAGKAMVVDAAADGIMDVALSTVAEIHPVVGAAAVGGLSAVRKAKGSGGISDKSKSEWEKRYKKGS